MKTLLHHAVFLASIVIFGQTSMAQPQPGTVLWSYNLGPASISSSPALGIDGAIYVATANALFALTNGLGGVSNKWVYPVSVAQSPAVDSDGVVYFGDMLANLRAVNADGTARWTLTLPDQLQSSPAIGLDGSVYFVAGGVLTAITRGGTQKWSCGVDSVSLPALSVALGNDGTIYVGSVFNSKFYAFSPDGTNKWTADLSPNGAGDSPVIGSDGTIYITSVALNAFEPNGTLLWYSPVQFQGRSPAIDADGTIYVTGAFNRSLYAVDPSGAIKWNALNFDNPYHQLATAPAVDNLDTVYYCVSNSLWAVSKQGVAKWVVGFEPEFYVYSDSAQTSPIIAPDGTIYAAIRSTLFAICGTNPPSSGPWPMYRQNARHTGKVEKPALNPPKKRADANFEFQLYAQLGQTNVIETTTNLSTWTALTNVVITNVPMDVVDLSASNHTFRFYRSLVP